MRVVLLFLLILTFSVHAAQALAPEERSAVVHDLQHGLADSALVRLAPVTTPDSRDGEAHLLLCRVSLQLEHWDAAVSACQRAVALDPDSSTNHVWYGRALGEKADRVSFFSAYGLGKRVRAEFEKAAALDPHNAEALADLGEYYDEAPAVVGGGKDKAAAVAGQLDSVDRARAEELRGHIAESQHDTAGAQQHYRAAIAAANEPANYWMVLASFYRRQGDLDQMEDAIHSGIAADRVKGVPLVDAAHLLTRAGRDPELATRLLREYLASPAQSEEEPAFRVHRFLATLLQKQGDGDGAAREVATATSIASVYHPGKQPATNTGR